MSSEVPLPLAVVADPVRLRLVRRLRDAGPASLADLAAAAGVHVNTVRPHLAALERAGLAVREHLVTGRRGRPPVSYRLGPGWELAGTETAGLTGLLACALASPDPGPGRLRELGRIWGRRSAGAPGTRPAREVVPPAMAALGFAAAVGPAAVDLSDCPCPLVLPADPALVCGLAVSAVEGLVASASDGLRAGPSRHDPGARRCRVALRRQAGLRSG